MKVTRVLFGIGVGVAAGFAVSLRNRDDQSVKNNTIDGGQPTGAQSELQRELETMKQSFNDILNYSSQIKNEGTEFGSSIGDEIKTLIGNFKSDINPNIEKIKSHIENLQN
ncbi:YtxH domain-containing protein, partial [Staphylococcus warneri]|uniref:YtxH domain-containing protein n=1 Tax=Staphylococcus warneri TaxID=1292 RepID=UPI000D1FC1B3